MEKAIDTTNREVVISQALSAPIEVVWKAWTNPNHIKNWWGPNGFTNTITKMDLVPGGVWSLVMHGPDGTDYDNESVFTEVIPHQKIAYNHISGHEFLATIEFEAKDNQTYMRWQMLFQTPEELTRIMNLYDIRQGLRENVERLVEYLKKQ